MGRIITVLLIGLAPLIVLGIRECAPPLRSLAPPPQSAPLAAPADDPLAPLPEPSPEHAAPEPGAEEVETVE